MAAGVALGALAVGIVAAVDDGPEPSSASTPPSGEEDGATSTSGKRTISVTGLGEVDVKPDALRTWLGVQAQAPSANAALDQANERAATLLAALQGAGVSEDDIQTSGISLSPVYDSSGRRITAYQASNQVTAVLRDLDRAGATLDAVAGLVGDDIRIDGVSFFVDDLAAAESEARAAAIDDARRRADDYARAAGVSVGEVLIISETTVDIPAPLAEMAAADGAGSARDSVPLSSGTQTVSLQVSVVYAIG
jgi:hypothetical protein